jgi:branched-chain amino acid transport system ATP-binding protein
VDGTATRDPVAPLLSLVELCGSYGRGESVVRDVTLAVGAGEVVGLLGANGAGKSTVLRAVSGLVRTTGQVLLDGRPLVGSPEGRARLGVAHVPEGRRLFGAMSVLDNLLAGAIAVPRRQRDPERLDRVFQLFPELRLLARRDAAWLSGGEQQMVAVGRALMAQPSVVLLDEPTLGLAPLVVNRLAEAVAGLAAEGLAVLVAEENLGFAAAVAERVYVLRAGRVADHGPADVLLGDATLRPLFLG